MTLIRQTKLGDWDGVLEQLQQKPDLLAGKSRMNNSASALAPLMIVGALAMA